MRIFLLIFAVLLTSFCIFSFDKWSQQFLISLAITALAPTISLSDSKISENSKNSDILEFPNDFIFGVSSSAYQIEGGWKVDGKSPSIWDTFTHDVDRAVDVPTADIGPNSYLFFNDDINAVKSVGFQHYRFSISWTRIMPNGSAINHKGIEYYRKIIDELIANDIEPIVTIFHWDLPQFLQDLGGLTNPIFVDYYEAYVDVLFNAFGDKVKRWITVNEPYMNCVLSYDLGFFAPAIKSPGVGSYLCVHHLILAHSAAYHLYKRKYFKKFNGQVGLAIETVYYFPSPNVSPEEHRRAMQYRFGWNMNPIFGSGGYPQVMVDELEARSAIEGRAFSRLPKFSDKQKKLVRGSADFLGLNYYSSAYLNIDKTKLHPREQSSWFTDCGCTQSTDPLWKSGISGWLHSVPDGFRLLLNWIKTEYNNPKVIITENGWLDGGELEDDDRIDYFDSHLKVLAKAINEDKCNIVGYTAWSLVDSYEWASGYKFKFGLFSVNYTSARRERIPKKSVGYWKKFLKSRKFLK